MSRFVLPLGFVALAVCIVGMPAPAARAAPPVRVEEELVDRVRKTIDNGVRYLKKQSRDGTWEGIVLSQLASMEGGQTALATLALLNCGLKHDDPAVAPALKYLRELPPVKTYVVALQNLVFAEARQLKDLPLIERNATWLVTQAKRDKDGQLIGWSYPMNDFADNSNTQYALLGLYAAKQAGIKIDDKVWREIQAFYTRTQRPEMVAEVPTGRGYWTYYNHEERGGSISMTVAGVCGLLIAGMGLDQSGQELDPATGVAKKCGIYPENAAVAKGMKWVAEYFTFESAKSSFYNIYGMERLGRISGQRFIGIHDWYREGCELLVKLQDPTDGSITRGKGIDGATILSTSFALLFLSKGRTPVLISKFAWGDFQVSGKGSVEVPPNKFPTPNGEVNWNRKHNDTRHLVDFCSKELFNGVPLSWQVYDARRRDFGNDGNGGRSGKEKILEEVGSLLQSPVLYLNGHGPFVLSPAQEEILKTYIEEGGFLIAEACCGDPVFAKSFKAMMLQLFPDNKFRVMSPEHAIWKIFPGVLPTDFPDVEVMERGCRTVAVFSPSPLAGFWEEAKYMPKDGKNPANKGEKAYCLARNIVAYATGLELPKPKLSTTKLQVKGAETGVTRSHFKALQFKLTNEAEPAPDAMKNLMGYLRDNARLDVALNSAVLAPFDEQVSNFKFMYMHARKPLELGEGAIENIQSNLQTGGLLLADAACGGYDQWKAFDASFRATCVKMFPDRKLVVITEKTDDGKEDPLFKIAREAGINLKNTRCRRELADGKGPEPEMRNYPVLLEGIKIDGRWVVVYSKYDIGCAIEGHKAADCLGYDKESALRIAAAVVLYSLKR